MTKFIPHLAKLSCRQYAEGLSFEPRQQFYLYTDCSTRFTVTHERSTKIGSGLDRDDALAEIGIFALEKDTDEFVQDFINLFCNCLSLFELNALIPALIKARDDWEAERQLNISKLEERLEEKK